MQVTRCKSEGYWKDKLYWHVRLQGKDVCYISIKNPDYDNVVWTVWSDTCDKKGWFKDFPLDETMKATAWKHVDFGGNCGPGSPCCGGMRKTIFGKAFERVCRTTFRFDDPDADALPFIKKMVEIRKQEIIGSTG